MSRALLVMGQGGKTFTVRRSAHESVAEFQGRALCVIEDRLGRAKGTRWVEWSGGHLDGLGVAFEHTGSPYTDRKARIPGLYNEAEIYWKWSAHTWGEFHKQETS